MKSLYNFLQRIKFFLCLLIIGVGFSYIDSLVLEPYIQSKYAYISIRHYDNNIWTYIAYVFAAIGLVFMIYTGIIERSLKDTFGCFAFFALLFIFIFSMLKRPIKKINLIANTWFTTETFQEKYEVSKRQDSTIVLRAQTENIFDGIFQENTLNTIKKNRKEKNLPSLHDLKDGDTINVTFTKGYLDIKYLK